MVDPKVREVILTHAQSFWNGNLMSKASILLLFSHLSNFDMCVALRFQELPCRKLAQSLNVREIIGFADASSKKLDFGEMQI